MNIYTLFSVISQSILTLYFIITHWIPLYPWNDLSSVSFKYERPLNFFMNCIQIVVMYGSYYQINALMVMGLIFWSTWMYGHTTFWWIPYFLGASKSEMLYYNKTFGNTYKFLKTYDNHPAPDACHTVLGILSCLVLVSIYMAYFLDGHHITALSTLTGIIAGIALFIFLGFMSRIATGHKKAS